MNWIILPYLFRTAYLETVIVIASIAALGGGVASARGAWRARKASVDRHYPQAVGGGATDPSDAPGSPRLPAREWPSVTLRTVGDGIRWVGEVAVFGGIFGAALGVLYTIANSERLGSLFGMILGGGFRFFGGLLFGVPVAIIGILLLWLLARRLRSPVWTTWIVTGAGAVTGGGCVFVYADWFGVPRVVSDPSFGGIVAPVCLAALAGGLASARAARRATPTSG